jgi:hypothetical protein
MNNNKRTHVGSPERLSAGRLYTTSPDAVQRMYPEVQTRSGRAYADPLSYDHPWPSMRDYARLLALRYEALRTRHTRTIVKCPCCQQPMRILRILLPAWKQPHIGRPHSLSARAPPPQPHA